MKEWWKDEMIYIFPKNISIYVSVILNLVLKKRDLLIFKRMIEPSGCFSGTVFVLNLQDTLF